MPEPRPCQVAEGARHVSLGTQSASLFVLILVWTAERSPQVKNPQQKELVRIAHRREQSQSMHMHIISHCGAHPACTFAVAFPCISRKHNRPILAHTRASLRGRPPRPGFRGPAPAAPAPRPGPRDPAPTARPPRPAPPKPGRGPAPHKPGLREPARGPRGPSPWPQQARI